MLGANFDFYVGIDWDSQPTMMQVAGGMDRLPAALATQLGSRIVYRAAVREIRQSERGVWAIYADADGQLKRVDADYCVSTIPLPVLSGIEKDLSQPVQAAIAAAPYAGAGKIGLQFKRRFWEEDDQIYGGRSWTDQEIGTLSIHRTASKNAKGYSSVTTWISPEPCAGALRPNDSGWRSNRAPAFIRNTRTSSTRRSRSRGLACPGAAARGERKRLRHTKRLPPFGNRTAVCILPAIT